MKENIEPFEPCLVCKIRPESVVWKDDKKVISCPFIQYMNRISASVDLPLSHKRTAIAEFREVVKAGGTPMSGCPVINYQPLENESF